MDIEVVRCVKLAVGRGSVLMIEAETDLVKLKQKGEGGKV